MNRRTSLKRAVILLAMLAAVAVSIPFIKSLSPAAPAVANYRESLVLKLDDLSIGQSEVTEVRGRPIYVTRISSTSIRIIDLIPGFAGSIVGCNVEPFRSSEMPAVYFRENCRGNWYDKDGVVLAGSHPQAEDLKHLPWKFDEGKFVFDDS